MAEINDAEQRSGSRGKQTGISPSAAKLKRILGDSPACRMLTPYEIELLRKAVQETEEVSSKVYAKKNKTSQR